MIELLLGPSGSGKSTRMINQANEEYKTRSGHILYVDNADSQMFHLDHAVRLINMKQYHIINPDRLYGLLAGLLADDFDIERIFIDGLHKEILRPETMEETLRALVRLATENHVDFIIALNLSAKDIPEMEGVTYTDLGSGVN